MTVTTLPVNPFALQHMPSSIMRSNHQPSNVGVVTSFDSRNLNDLKVSGDQEQALQGVAEQFESLFLQMVLKQMRQASEALQSDDDNPLFSSREHKTYQEFFDGQISIEMSKGRMGLAESIVAQLGREQATGKEMQDAAIEAASVAVFPSSALSTPVNTIVDSEFKNEIPAVALPTQEQQISTPQDLSTTQSNRAFVQPLLHINLKESSV
ncbi:rod-binding protein [Vibrio sp. ZSDE26]|uniref:Rod-binding protein n=1 Tax=Vibrio amylolyticus TaxID=2847292 RepID=A0A9X1XHP4_9VIBR|nr:rod-binding protein [Vibrio amylolyticus]MCK6263352.1 rod-binding protein [Vibrio amylolyticus]